MLRRSRVQAIVLGLCALAMLLFTISHIFGSSDGIPAGTPPVVIVTVLDAGHYSGVYVDSIKQNRNDYAKKHGERYWSMDVGTPLLILSLSRLCNVFHYTD